MPSKMSWKTQLRKEQVRKEQVRKGQVRKEQFRKPQPWVRPAAAALAALAVFLLPAATWPEEPKATGTPAPKGLWVDQAEATGLVFRHENGARGKWYFPEINGSGVALLDADQDGDLDILLLQGADIDAGRPAVSRDRLFRNDLVPSGRLRFVDVTEASGLDAVGYSMAAAAADFDNDGRTDLYIGAYGDNSMWRNVGNGDKIRFEDVTEQWQVADRRWTAALVVFDYDRDGRLDLYLGNYLRFEPARHKTCTISTGLQDYCHPSSYPAEHDLFFHNRLLDGQPHFVDSTRRAFGRTAPEPTLGLAVLDMDDDGRLDLYAAHDDRPNRLWQNLFNETSPAAGPDGKPTTHFRDEALLTGTAVNGAGDAEASMGVTAGDIDGDGDTDLFMSHLTSQSNTLYVNRGGIFGDETRGRGLGAPSLPFTGFGTHFLDADLDGDLDLFVANGAVQVIESQRRAGESHPFHQTDQYFENQSSENRSSENQSKNHGTGRFVDATDRAGASFSVPATSRGAAVGDLDNDGDLDLVISDNGGTARLLINQTISRPADSKTAQGPAWLGLRLVEAHGRDALGALVRLHAEGKNGPLLVRRVGVDGSYASSSDPRLVFGLGGLSEADRTRLKLEITWTDGLVESFPMPPSGRYTTLRRGSAAAARPTISRNVDVP